MFFYFIFIEEFNEYMYSFKFHNLKWMNEWMNE